MRIKKLLIGLVTSLLIVIGITATSSSSKAATYNYPVATVTAQPGAYLYNSQGQLLPEWILMKNSDWRVGKIIKVNTMTLYQVATDAWLRADQSQTNFDARTGQVLQTNSNDETTDNLVQAMFQELNRLRAQNGRSPLTLNPELNAFTQQRALTNLRQGYLKHENTWGDLHPSNSGENLEITLDGHSVAKTAINSIAQFYDDNGNPDLGHRKLMLNPYFTEVGIGVVPDGHGRFYIAQTLLRPNNLPYVDGMSDYFTYVQEKGERAPYFSHYDNAGKYYR